MSLSGKLATLVLKDVAVQITVQKASDGRLEIHVIPAPQRVTKNEIDIVCEEMEIVAAMGAQHAKAEGLSKGADIKLSGQSMPLTSA